VPEKLEIGLKPSAQVKILYTSDLHGNVEKMKYLSTVVKQARRSPFDGLLLDSGDWSRGSALCDQFGGEPMAKIMEYLHYDAVALGEGELAWGVRGLKKLLKVVTFPFLCANIQGDLPEGIRAFTVKEMAGLKIGIIGISHVIKLPERHITMISPEEGIAASLKDLQSLKVDLVLLLSHLGIEKDREVAKHFPSLNLIIGGHSHVRLEKPEQAGGVLIAHGGAFGEYLGSISLDIGRTLTVEQKE
jgi:2',3'-cyclic-nucleotide 2'-phosphodiesterase (5'-nucleotidase family)